jgi:hypothetical protein
MLKCAPVSLPSRMALLNSRIGPNKIDGTVSLGSSFFSDSNLSCWRSSLVGNLSWVIPSNARPHSVTVALQKLALKQPTASS